MSAVPDQRGRWGRGGVRKRRQADRKSSEAPEKPPFSSCWGSRCTRQASPAAPVLTASPTQVTAGHPRADAACGLAGVEGVPHSDTGKSGGTAGLKERHCPVDASRVRPCSAPCPVVLPSFACRSWHPPGGTGKAPVRATFRDLCPPACQASGKPGPQHPSCHSPGPKCPVLGNGPLPGSFS